MSDTGRRLDALLVNPGSRSQLYQALGTSLSAIEPPVWAALIATVLRRQGYSVAILDTEAEDLTADESARRIAGMDPLLTVIVVYGHHPSASTQNMTSTSQICAAVKQQTPEQKVLLVGGHVSALPERTLREEQVDFVAGGEGPVSVLELLQALKSDRPEDLTDVRGLWYWKDGNVQKNPPAPLIQDLDQEMPELAWDLLPMERYRAHNWHCFGKNSRTPYASLYTTLGCPYHCSFCCIQAPFKTGEKELKYRENVNSYRYWSPQAVVGQIDHLVSRYGVRNIKIADEMFVLNPKHVLGICDLLIERNYGLNIWAYARVDTVRDGMVDKLKKAGFNWMALGIESASDRVRIDADKRFDQEEIFRTIERVRAAGINVIGNYIFGLPEDNLETMQATLDLAIELNCEFANFYSAMAYPGSALYEAALQQGLPLPETWAGYSQHGVDTLPLPTKSLSAGEVLRFRDEATVRYFTSPRYLEMISRKFGAQTAEHIQRMISIPLVRKHVPGNGTPAMMASS